MTDYELLKWAAKAVGKWPALSHGAWLPLDDDGDALRLAVALRIVVQHAPTYVVAIRILGGRVMSCREEGADAYATRRAIVRAAAELQPLEG